MARMVTPGSTSSGYEGSRRSGPFFVTDLIRRFGVRAVVAIIAAAMLAFSPLAFLYWLNELRLASVVMSSVSLNQRVVVKPAQHLDEQERAEPGETALLQVKCLVPTIDGWRDLLSDNDPARRDPSQTHSSVRREQVYLRRSGSQLIPFGLLGPPPVSVWLPAGDYEILVVHDAPSREDRIDVPGRSFPWISVVAECSLKSREKTVIDVQLPHYDWGNSDVLLGVGDSEESGERPPSAAEFVRIVAGCEALTPIPTPAGYLLTLAEPRIHHRDGHRGCVQDFGDLHSVPREWTRGQLARLRRWLPDNATQANSKLMGLIDRLGWREFLQGWYCYAAAGVTGLVFTRWGAIAMMEPWRRGPEWHHSLGLLVRIFFLSAGVWFLIQVLFH